HIDRYDTIETKQIGLKQEINTELQAGKITSADRKTLLKMMQKVEEHRKTAYFTHDESLIPDDKKQLDGELNQVYQKLAQIEEERAAAKQIATKPSTGI